MQSNSRRTFDRVIILSGPDETKKRKEKKTGPLTNDTCTEKNAMCALKSATVAHTRFNADKTPPNKRGLREAAHGDGARGGVVYVCTGSFPLRRWLSNFADRISVGDTRSSLPTHT